MSKGKFLCESNDILLPYNPNMKNMRDFMEAALHCLVFFICVLETTGYLMFRHL